MNRLLLGMLLSLLPVSARGATLDQVLAVMDHSAPAFEGMTASLKRSDFTAVIDDTSDESGLIRMVRPRNGRIRMLIEFNEPEARSVAFADKKAEIYYPKMKTVQVFDLGKYRNLIDQFLLLGFGSSGSELKKNYDVKLIAQEDVRGVTTSRLELLPKSAPAQEHLKKVELWVNPEGYPVQQKFYRPSGDYTLVNYSELKINPRLPADALTLKLPSGVRREYPQK